MAWIWNPEVTGTLRAQISGTSASKSFAGVNANVLNSSPDLAVAQLNKLLIAAGTQAIVNTNTRFSEVTGVEDNE